MGKVRVLSTVISIYNGLAALLFIALGVLSASFGKEILTSGHEFAGAFTSMIGAISICLGLISIVPVVFGVLANIKAHQWAADEKTAIKMYYTDSIVKGIINGLAAASSVMGLFNGAANGNFIIIGMDVVVIAFAVLSFILCGEVSKAVNS